MWCWSFLLYMYSKSSGQGYVPVTAVCERLPDPGNASLLLMLKTVAIYWACTLML